MRTGDFSELLAPIQYGSPTSAGPPAYPTNRLPAAPPTAGPNGTIYDPTTCLPFPGNKRIPTGRLNQAALNYLNAFPLPNNMTGTGGNVGLSENYDSFPQGSQNWNDFDVRIDWAATSKDNLCALQLWPGHSDQAEPISESSCRLRHRRQPRASARRGGGRNAHLLSEYRQRIPLRSSV
jgi:hypothetical protein